MRRPRKHRVHPATIRAGQISEHTRPQALSAGQGLGGALHALSLQNKSRLVLSARCHAVVAERAGVLQLPP